MAVPWREVLAEFSDEERARIKARTKEILAEEATLAELRKAQKLTQQKLAKKLGIKQESVSSIESRSDMLISTLRGYVQAMGGQLSFRVTFPKSAPVEIFSLGTAKSVRRTSAVKKSSTARKSRSA